VSAAFCVLDTADMEERSSSPDLQQQTIWIATRKASAVKAGPQIFGAEK
jgi:hypothetical protein